MNQLKNILMGLDFSMPSLNALRQAVRVAGWRKTRLHAFHCVDASLVAETAWDSGTTSAELGQQLVTKAEAALAATLEAEKAPEGTTASVDCDLPVESLLRQTRRWQPDLLVAGLQGASGLPRGAGSFAVRCLRKVDSKVMLVARRQRGKFSRVLACVDFSDTSRAVVEQAWRVAEMDGGRICFLHVFYPPWRRLGYRSRSLDEMDSVARDHEQRLLTRLKEFVGAGPGVKATYRVVAGPQRGLAIAEFARKVRANLIILGRRGLSNLKYVLLGSTAEMLAREVGCSLLVVPAAPTAFRSQQEVAP